MRRPQETFTNIATGQIFDVTNRAYKRFSLQVIPTGAVVSWIVILEGSLDGTIFTPILVHTDTVGSGITLFGAEDTPVMYFRLRCRAVVLGAGTNLQAYALGVS
jgi:hypothetical protein